MQSSSSTLTRPGWPPQLPAGDLSGPLTPAFLQALGRFVVSSLRVACQELKFAIAGAQPTP
jgi:hypothetical protein